MGVYIPTTPFRKGKKKRTLIKLLQTKMGIQ